MSFPWDSIRIILNVKKTLPLLVVAIIVDILAYSFRPDIYLFWIACLLIAATIVLFGVQAYLIKVQKEMTSKEHLKALTHAGRSGKATSSRPPRESRRSPSSAR